MTKDDVLASLRKQPVPFTGGGFSCFLRPWNTATRAGFSLWRADNPGPVGLMEKLFVLSVCDEAGALLFGDTPDDIAAVSGLDGAAVEAVGFRVLDMAGWGGEGKKPGN